MRVFNIRFGSTNICFVKYLLYCIKIVHFLHTSCQHLGLIFTTQSLGGDSYSLSQNKTNVWFQYQHSYVIIASPSVNVSIFIVGFSRFNLKTLVFAVTCSLEILNTHKNLCEDKAWWLKGVFSKLSGNCIVVQIFCLLS